MSAWAAMFAKAGLSEIATFPVVNEAAVVRGTKPGWSDRTGPDPTEGGARG